MQVLKDPIGSKGARLTTFITIPSRYLVLLPTGDRVAISSRIEDEEERERLKALVENFVPGDADCGYIVRTAAEGAEVEALRADMLFLNRLWEIIGREAERRAPKRLIHEDLSLATRVIRDMASSEIQHILVDSEEAFARLQKFAETFMHDMMPEIEMYTGPRPILDLYGIEDEIEKALETRGAVEVRRLYYL